MRVISYICWWLAVGFTALWFGYGFPYLIVTLTVLGATMVWMDRDHPPGGHTP